MESSRADADLQRARLQVDRAQKVFERQTTLHKAGATPQIEVRGGRAGVRGRGEGIRHHGQGRARGARRASRARTDKLAAAKRLLAQKSEELEDAQGAFEAAEVRAPVAGVIVGRKGELGKSARDSGDQLFQIATDLFTLEVVAGRRRRTISKRIHPGQQALVLVLDLQSAGMPGVVKEIKEPEVIVEFNSSMPAIKPGMRADVRVKLD